MELFVKTVEETLTTLSCLQSVEKLLFTNQQYQDDFQREVIALAKERYGVNEGSYSFWTMNRVNAETMHCLIHKMEDIRYDLLVDKEEYVHLLTGLRGHLLSFNVFHSIDPKLVLENVLIFRD